MGIFDALTTSVAGLQAQSFALQNISGNIANSQTTAFKGTDTSFEDLIPDQDPAHQVSGSVTAMSRPTNTVQGSVQTSSVSTFMAIRFPIEPEGTNRAASRPKVSAARCSSRFTVGSSP